MVPAFTGIGAPHWKSDATAAYVGMTRLTGQAELVRAALDSVAYQIADLVLPAAEETGTVTRELRVAGGPANNPYLMQFQSDILSCPVVIPEHEELSGIGSAYLAGLSMGMYDYETLKRQQKTTVYRPQMSEAERVHDSPEVSRDLTEMVIQQNAPEILRRFNACDCEKCMSELARLTAEEIPARYMKMPELADLNWNGFSSDERMLIDSLKKNAVTVMIRLMIANKKRNFH